LATGAAAAAVPPLPLAVVPGAPALPLAIVPAALPPAIVPGAPASPLSFSDKDKLIVWLSQSTPLLEAKCRQAGIPKSTRAVMAAALAMTYDNDSQASLDVAASILAFRLASLACVGRELVSPVDGFVVVAHSQAVGPGMLVVSLRPDHDVDTVFQCESVSVTGAVLVALSGPVGDVLVPPVGFQELLVLNARGLSASPRLCERPPRLPLVAFIPASLPGAAASAVSTQGGKWLSSISPPGSVPSVTDLTGPYPSSGVSLRAPQAAFLQQQPSPSYPFPSLGGFAQPHPMANYVDVAAPLPVSITVSDRMLNAASTLGLSQGNRVMVMAWYMRNYLMDMDHIFSVISGRLSGLPCGQFLAVGRRMLPMVLKGLFSLHFVSSPEKGDGLHLRHFSRHGYAFRTNNDLASALSDWASLIDVIFFDGKCSVYAELIRKLSETLRRADDKGLAGFHVSFVEHMVHERLSSLYLAAQQLGSQPYLESAWATAMAAVFSVRMDDIFLRYQIWDMNGKNISHARPVLKSSSVSFQRSSSPSWDRPVKRYSEPVSSSWSRSSSSYAGSRSPASPVGSPSGMSRSPLSPSRSSSSSFGGSSGSSPKSGPSSLPCINSMLHFFKIKGAAPCSKSNDCKFSHNIRSFRKEALLEAVSHSRADSATIAAVIAAIEARG
jgi:hypothetical protein